MRRACKVDGNHSEIVEALRSIGASVQDLSREGKGCPDILVGYEGQNHIIEIKTDSGKLTTDQVGWHSKWKGAVYIAHSIGEALKILGK